MNPSILLTILLLFTFRFSSYVSFGKPLAPALYIFGDSLFDSGNNNLLPTIARADYSPYGVDFPKGVTGRFTNGRTTADFIAELLKLPYPPPFLRISFEPTPTTGLNYASASCGILPNTGSLLGKCLSMDNQLDLFHHTVKSKLSKYFTNTNELSNYLSKSIFVFSVGSNDYLNNYLQPKYFDVSRRYTPQAFAQLLSDTLSLGLQRLYHLGARKIVVFEIGPIGCIPSIARKHKENNTKCFEESNKLISFFNNKLPIMLRNLTSTLPRSVFVHGRVNWLGYDAIVNCSLYGLLDTRNPCCRTWDNGTSSCIPLLKPCPNPNKHYFFDAFHLTETVCSMVAARCFNDSSVCSPAINELILM